MTVNTLETFTDWVAANGVNKDWSYTFKIDTQETAYLEYKDGADGDVVTTQADLEFHPDSDFVGGYLRYPAVAAALAATFFVRVRRIVPYTQPDAIGNEGAFYPENHERVADRQVMQIQQLGQDIDRAVKTVVGEVGGVFEAGVVEDNLLASDGANGVKDSGVSPADIIASTEAAAESAAAAALSETAAETAETNAETAQTAAELARDEAIAAVASIGGPMIFQGVWDASAGTFPGTVDRKKGWTYLVSVAGTVDGQDFEVNDTLIALVDDASTTVYAANWYRVEADLVQSVAGLQGIITAAALRTALNVREVTDSADMTVDPANVPTRGNVAAYYSLRADGSFNVKEPPFNAVGDGAADDTAALQAAITAAIAATGGRGGAVRFPLGNYKVTDKLVADLTGAAGQFEDCLNLLGLGSPFTRITYAGGAAEALLEINGDTTYVANHLRIEGITFFGDLTAGGIGVDITTSAFPHMQDVNFWNFALGLRCDNVEQALFERCNWRWNTKGFEFLPSVGTTDPNSLTFVESQVGNNTDYGFSIEHANAVVWVGGSIQYNGTTGVAGEYGCKFIDPGTGYGNISFFGTIFEGNGGDADLWVDATTDASMTTLVGCSFARANNVAYAVNHIRMSGTAAVQRLTLRGNTHRHFNTYVENAARPYINLANANAKVHDDGSNYYQSTVEDPAWVLTAYNWGMTYSGQLWHLDVNMNYEVGPSFSLVGGVMAQALNDLFNTLIPYEIRAQNIQLTAVNGVKATGSLKSSHATGGIGYDTGAGGTVTQITNKATGVTLSKASGQITTHNAALAAATIVSFVLTNTAIAAGDTLVLNHVSGGTLGAYTLNAACGAGVATITLRNNTGGSLSEALVIGFNLIKGVTS
jgi:hypothetical protein